MGIYSTTEAARKCSLHPITLQRWVSERLIVAPRKQRVGGVVVRLWTDDDLEKIREYKAAHYRKGRGRKKGQKKSASR